MSATWQRQRDDDGKVEPSLWFGRFTEYRLMGPTRSMIGCVNAERVRKGYERSDNISGSWRRAIERWNWVERARAWDEYQRQQRELEEEAERLEWRQRRRDLLQGFFGKLAKALDNYDTEDAKLSELTQAVRTASQELRAEYDDLPTEKRQTVDIDLSQLTEDQLLRVANGEDPARVLASSGTGRTGEAQANGDE